MKPTILYPIFALCLIATPTTATNLHNPTTGTLNDISISLLSEDDTSNEASENSSLQCDKQRTQANEQQNKLEQCIATHLPKFFQTNKKPLEKIQQGNRQAILVIGQTGSGKSALIGALMGHKFILQDQKITETFEGAKMSYYHELLMNNTPNSPKIGHSPNQPHTTFPQAYLHPKTNLAFIDTAELSDTTKDGAIINLCSAIALRSLIETIGNVKCIIGVIDYNTFSTGQDSLPFANLLNVTSSLLKNQSLQTLTSSIVLAFTKIPEHITKRHITNQIKKRCFNLIKIRKKNQITPEYNIADNIYKALFPSYHGIKNKKDVAFFLIRQSMLLKQGLVSKKLLPTLQNATKVHSKHIHLPLSPYLLDKTKKWLTKKAQTIAKDIRHKEKIDNNITHIAAYLSFKQTQLLSKEKFLHQFTDPNNTNIQNNKERFLNYLQNTIQNNTQTIETLDLKIKYNSDEMNIKLKEITALNTRQIELYKNISPSYNRQTNAYEYIYDDLPISHIIYADHIRKAGLKRNDRISDNYKVLSITKNYPKGILNITLQNNIQKRPAVLERLQRFVLSVITNQNAKSKLHSMKYASPRDFKIYAEKKHIHSSKINTLRNAIEHLEENWLKFKRKKKLLEKEIQSNKNELEQVKLNLLNKEKLIRQTKTDINTKTKDIQNLKYQLEQWHSQTNALSQKIQQNQIIPYIITQVAPFIGFHNRYQHDIHTCKRYINNLQKNNKHDDHTDNQIQLQLKSNIEDDNYDIQHQSHINNTNNKHKNQTLRWQVKNTNQYTLLEDEKELQKGNNNQNISSSSNRNTSILASVASGTVGIISRLLNKKN